MPFIPIVCLGLSHHTAPIELRERLACSLDELLTLVEPVSTVSSRQPAIAELVVISTCNRTEIYACVGTSDVNTRSLLANHLAMIRGLDPAELDDHLYYHAGQTAVEHLFSVAAGLDSLVLGEPQILGQVTDAYMLAVEAKTIGPVLTALFRAAIRTGKRARTETAISSKPASIGSVAVAKAQEIIGDLRQRRPLIVGMGEMGQLAMQTLRSRGVRQIAIANRTRQVAEAFAEGCGGNAYAMAELNKALVEADLVISATGAPHVIINPEIVREAMNARNNRELVLVDIAVPRDIDPAVTEIPGVYLFDVDDLQGSLDEALASRELGVSSRTTRNRNQAAYRRPAAKG
jgi:glutamyl-tRNA reductase